jgi:hypothetical protein
MRRRVVSAKRLAILGCAILLPVACAQGVQDSALDGLGTAATGDEIGSGAAGSTSSGGRPGGAAGAGQSGSLGDSGSSSGSGNTTSTGGSGTAGSGASGGTNGGSSAGGASAGAASAGKGGGGTSNGGSSAGGSSAGAAAGGKGGSSAGGSSAGSSSAGAPAGGATGATGFYVQYLNMKTMSSSSYISCELRVINNGTGSVAVSSLKVRYYLTNEPKATLQMMNNFQHIAIPGNQADLTVTNTVVKMPTPVANADTYIEFSFSSGPHPMLAPQEVLEYSWQVQGPAPSTDVFTQSNDYSWDGTNTALAPAQHIVALQNGTVIWGTPP